MMTDTVEVDRLNEENDQIFLSRQCFSNERSHPTHVFERLAGFASAAAFQGRSQ